MKFKSFVTVLFFSLVTRAYSALTPVWYSSYTASSFTFTTWNSIAIDTNSNSYVVGATSIGVDNIDGLFSKYSSTGGLMWTQTYNSTANNYDSFYGVAITTSGNILVCGTEYRPDLSQDYNILVRKYSPSGLLLWTTSYNDSENRADLAFDCAIDSFTDTYWVVGVSSGHNGIVLKYDSTGSLLNTFIYTSSGPYEVRFNGVVSDTNSNIIVVGYDNRSDLNQAADLWTGEFNSTGSLIWITTYNSISNNWDEGFDIARDTSGNFIVVGCELRPDQKNKTDCLLLKKYDMNGLLQWTTTYFSTPVAGDQTEGFGVNIDSNSNIWVTGLENRSDVKQSYNAIEQKWLLNGTLSLTSSYALTTSGAEAGYGIAIGTSGEIINAGYEFIPSSTTVNGFIRKVLQ